MTAIKLMTTLAALLLVGCSSGLSEQQLAAAEEQAKMLCQFRAISLPGTGAEEAIRGLQESVESSESSPMVEIARESLKIAKSRGCI